MENAPFDDQLSILYDNLLSLITSEKSSIHQERRLQEEEAGAFEKFKEEELKRLKEIEDELESKLWLKQEATQIIDLNVGGTHFISTSLSTLLKYPESALAQLMVSEKLPLYQDKVFINREGEAFSDLISFLRTGKFPDFLSAEHEQRFLNELDYWGIPFEDPEVLYDNRLKQFDISLSGVGLKLESSSTLVRKISMNPEVVSTLSPMTRISPYFEFKMHINSGIRTDSNVYLGVFDKSKFGSAQAGSICWQESPYTWYWDVLNSKLLRTDEFGVFSTVNGYGCECDDEEMVLGIFYDYRAKTISFYKKGICQGIAFSNVPAGLFPIIYMRFDYGIISISQMNLPKTNGFM